MKVAAIQMVSAMALQANLDGARVLLREAADLGAELAVLPEYFCMLGARDTDKLSIAEHYGRGPIQQFLAHAARDLNLWIIGGTLPLWRDTPDPLAQAGSGPKVFNTTLVYSPQGLCVARYDKIHLFRFDNGKEAYDESRVLQRGASPQMFHLAAADGHTWRVGLSICYDLRFPELYRAYGQEDADILVVPSAFTYTTGQAHWDVLLRARAIENQAYVMAPAQGGKHDNGRRTWGHTLVVDPWGSIVADRPEGAGVVMAELSQALIASSRVKLPALAHRVL